MTCLFVVTFFFLLLELKEMFIQGGVHERPHVLFTKRRRSRSELIRGGKALGPEPR